MRWMDTFKCFNMAYFRRIEKEEEEKEIRMTKFRRKKKYIYIYKLTNNFNHIYFIIKYIILQLYLIEKKIDMSTCIYP